MTADRLVERVRSARDPLFDEVWGALDAEFGPRGEIERRAVVARWLDRPGGAFGAAGLEQTYHLVGVRDAAGRLVAARDHHVVVDRAAGIVVVYMAHALVLPAYRRAGIGELLRDVAAADGAGARASVSPAADDVELLFAAEMEPWDPGDAASTARLVAYGRAGFAAIDPERIRYVQPDFGDLAVTGATARPIPLLARLLVTRVGARGASTIPAALAEAYVRCLYAVFATHCRAADLAPLAALSLDAIARGGREVALLRLPTSPGDRRALEPLAADRVVPMSAPS